VNDNELWLYTLCKKNDLIITDIEIRQLSFFRDLLEEWNKKINLVSRKNTDQIWKSHIALSLTLLFKIELSPGSKILDLGTGGGFPGIPLSIILQNCHFSLLDSTQKKITAVQSIIDELHLPNVSAVWGRAEDIGKKHGFHNVFDAVVARSVSGLANLAEWAFPFLKQHNDGQVHSIPASSKELISVPSLITFKGGEIEDEEKEARKRFPQMKLHTIPLIFNGSEEFENQDKKLVIATFPKKYTLHG
jgi:16S rRNA (guanine527-N7)-methyltransferase